MAGVDKPRAGGGDPDIRFLDHAELEALVRAVPEDALGPTERVLYLTAVMTGLRRELLALRWQDVDWTAGLIRVRRSFTRGEFGTAKSRRSSRAVLMADRVGAELERHFGASECRLCPGPDAGSGVGAACLRGPPVADAGGRCLRRAQLA